jgi:hypothetical protein
MAQIPLPLSNVRRAVSKQLRELGVIRCVLPDFLIVGAQKCGTSSLHAYLSEHPQVISSRVKEVHFFDRHYAKGTRWYRSNFQRSATIQRREQQIGKPVLAFEATPCYLFHPLAAQRIAQLIPQAKLIVLLRDPTVRAYSHYRHMVQRGRETLDFAEAIQQEAARLQGGYDSLSHSRFSYLARGLYKAQLETYFQFFPRDRVLILKSERLFNDPQGEYDKVLAFLELEPHRLTDVNAKNVGQIKASAIPLEDQLYAHFRPHNQELAELLGPDFNW